MKTTIRIIRLGTLLLGFSLLAGAGLEAADQTNAAPQRVGVYDSRAIAYACFWTTNYQNQLNEKAQAAKAARAAGDPALADRLENNLAHEQEKIHQQVFGTARPTDALAALESRLPKLEKQAGVSVLISKWDPRLDQYKAAEQVDVTDLLVREFNPSEKQLKVIAGIRSKPPTSSNPDTHSH